MNDMSFKGQLQSHNFQLITISSKDDGHMNSGGGKQCNSELRAAHRSLWNCAPLSSMGQHLIWVSNVSLKRYTPVHLPYNWGSTCWAWAMHTNYDTKFPGLAGRYTWRWRQHVSPKHFIDQPHYMAYHQEERNHDKQCWIQNLLGLSDS
jgi:hypothetical protein